MLEFTIVAGLGLLILGFMDLKLAAVPHARPAP